jgi:hypothetical protein
VDARAAEADEGGAPQRHRAGVHGRRTSDASCTLGSSIRGDKGVCIDVGRIVATYIWSYHRQKIEGSPAMESRVRT